MTANVSYGGPTGAVSLGNITGGDVTKKPRQYGPPVNPVPASIFIPRDRGQWTDLTLAALDQLWGMGYATASIGEYLGFTKNAVVGKVHRRDLPSRPSPIKRDPDAIYPSRRPAPRPVDRPTLPLLLSEQDGTDAIVPRVRGDWITEKRIAVLKELWPTARTRMQILDVLRRLPGPLWTSDNAVSEYAGSALKLKKPESFLRSVRPRTVPGPAMNMPRPAVPIERIRAIAPALPRPYARTTECVFPIGDPGTPGFRFCDVPHQNKSYCNEHESICWHKVRDRREDSAGHVAPVHSRLSLVGGGRSGFVQSDWDETR